MVKQLNYDPLEFLSKVNSFTPDFKELREGPYGRFPVFLCGNVTPIIDKKNLLDGSVNLGSATTFGGNYMLKVPNYTTFTSAFEPYLFMFDKNNIKNGSELVGKFSETAHVDGVVVAVSLRTLTKLDKHYGNTEGVTRRKEWVTLNNNNATIKAYQYIVDWDFFIEIAESYPNDLRSCPRITTPSKNGTITSYYHIARG